MGLHAWRTSLQGYWLAAIWVAWEVIQWVLMPSNVNRMAHLGGLVAGALAGVAARHHRPVDQRTQAAVSDQDPRQRQRARTLAAELRYDDAARTMLSVAQRSGQPEDWELLWAFARHVPRSAAGQEAQRAIQGQPLPTGPLRATLLRLQSEARRSAADAQLPGSG
jgi:hypothetical protein